MLQIVYFITNRGTVHYIVCVVGRWVSHEYCWGVFNVVGWIAFAYLRLVVVVVVVSSIIFSLSSLSPATRRIMWKKNDLHGESWWSLLMRWIERYRYRKPELNSNVRPVLPVVSVVPSIRNKNSNIIAVISARPKDSQLRYLTWANPIF